MFGFILENYCIWPHISLLVAIPPVQTQTLPPTIPMQDLPVVVEPEPATLPLEPIEQIESFISESFHIHYAGRKSKQKVIHQLQALAILLEEESHEHYQFSIQINTSSLK
ncbi:hypothetical protein ACT7C8_17320 [Bacillus cereus]